MARGTGEVAGPSRELAPAITGRERADNDPPVMEQLTSEIRQATSFIDTQTCRVRAHTDRMFGSQPQSEEEDATDKIAEVRPQIEILGEAIRHLHNATGELSQQMDRLEGHRLV